MLLFRLQKTELQHLTMSVNNTNFKQGDCIASGKSLSLHRGALQVLACFLSDISHTSVEFPLSSIANWYHRSWCDLSSYEIYKKLHNSVHISRHLHDIITCKIVQNVTCGTSEISALRLFISECTSGIFGYWPQEGTAEFKPDFAASFRGFNHSCHFWCVVSPLVEKRGICGIWWDVTFV